jgi:hypothetical protein
MAKQNDEKFKDMATKNGQMTLFRSFARRGWW